jgi:aspartate kinase
MEQVIKARVPIRIKNVDNPEGEGTIIFPDTEKAGSHSVHYRRPRRPTAITIKRNILVINVHSNRRSLSPDFFANIFTTLKNWRLSVDLISTSQVHISMALHYESTASVSTPDEGPPPDHDLHGAIHDLREYGTVDVIPNMAIVSLVGKQMKHMVGISGRMFTVLGDNNINIEMISQGRCLAQVPGGAKGNNGALTAVMSDFPSPMHVRFF